MPSISLQKSVYISILLTDIDLQKCFSDIGWDDKMPSPKSNDNVHQSRQYTRLSKSCAYFQRSQIFLAIYMKIVVITYISTQHRYFTIFLPKCYCYGSLRTEKMTMTHGNMSPTKMSVCHLLAADTLNLAQGDYSSTFIVSMPLTILRTHQHVYEVANYWTSKVWLKINGHCQPAWRWPKWCRRNFVQASPNG